MMQDESIDIIKTINDLAAECRFQNVRIFVDGYEGRAEIHFVVELARDGDAIERRTALERGTALCDKLSELLGSRSVDVHIADYMRLAFKAQAKFADLNRDNLEAIIGNLEAASQAGLRHDNSGNALVL